MDAAAGPAGSAPGSPLRVGMLPSMPTFMPTPAAAQGLELLAAAAAASSSKDPSSTIPAHSLARSGPFNPATSLPAKLVRRILDLEFVEMSEISVDSDLPQASTRAPTPARLPVTDISIWVERFSLMAAILVTRFPGKAAELFAYQASIIRAERNYEGKRWVVYDRQFRREALARKDLNWSTPDSRLYNEAFTGRAKAIARCNHCLQDDHVTSLCPRNPNQPLPPWFPDMLSWPGASFQQGHRPSTPRASICRRWNEGRCKFQACKYRHECLACGGPHMALECPQRCSNPRSRSPVRGVACQPMFGPGQQMTTSPLDLRD